MAPALLSPPRPAPVRSDSTGAAAKMAAVLQQVLERVELSKLPKPVQAKLERFLADQQSEIDGLRARHERFKVDSGESEKGELGERGRPLPAPYGEDRADQGLSSTWSSRCLGGGSGPATRLRRGGLGSGRVSPSSLRFLASSNVSVLSDERSEGRAGPQGSLLASKHFQDTTWDL